MDSRRLIGRDADLGGLVTQLSAGSHQILAGPRRTGKTSICDAAASRLQKNGFYAVSVDLFALESLAALAERITARAIANRPPVKKIQPGLRAAGRTVRQSARITATLKNEFGTDIEFAFTPGRAQRNPEAAFDYALGLLERLAIADNRQLILYLDEFQEIAVSGHRFGDPDMITKKMRAILQRSPHVTCLFAGSIEHMMRELFGTQARAMYQFGSFFTLDPIERDSWVAGLRKAYQRDKCTITDTALELLLGTSAGAPRATMLLAQQSHVVAVEQGLVVIDTTEVLQGLDYAMAAEQPAHESEVARIRKSGVHAFPVALRIARGEAPYGSELDAKQTGRALKALRNAGIAAQVKARDWHIVDSLLARYLIKFDTF